MSAISVLSLVSLDFSFEGSIFSSVIPSLILDYDFIYCQIALRFSFDFLATLILNCFCARLVIALTLFLTSSPWP